MVVNELTFYVINPATKESKLIKEPDTPLGSPSYGFVFDSEINDYKLVRVTLQKTDILTLKNNSWRSITMNDHSAASVMKVHVLVDSLEQSFGEEWPSLDWKIFG